MWMYHSHVEEGTDVPSGLMGPLIVTARGQAKPDGSPVDVDREIVATRVRADVSQAVPATEATRTAMKKSPKARKGRAGRGQRVQRTGLDR